MVQAAEDSATTAAAHADSDPDPHDRWLLRGSRPVHFEERTNSWQLSRHRDCVRALRDPRLSAELGQRQRRRDDPLPRSMLTTDAPLHARLRGPAAAVVSPARVARLKARLEPVVTHFADAAARRGELDVVPGYAAPVAVVALSALLGVPGAELRPFARLARAAAANLDPLAGEPQAADGRAAALELADYLRQLVEQGRAAPGEALDVLVGRAAGPGGEPALAPEDGLSACVLFVVGGYEPLAGLIANGLHLLATWPAEAQRLRDAPELWRRAIDELLRFESPIPFTARVCREDVPVGDQVLPRGATVVLLLAAANRDPEVFVRPDVLDVGRSPNPMLAFGAGPHTCLAASTTRAVGELALSTALGRFPVLAPAAEPARWRPALVPRGLESLPLRVAE